MNKKISKLVLIGITISMLIVVTYIGVSTKENYSVVDIKGNRAELDDVNVVYQQRNGIYKTTEVKISKDDIDVDKNAKEAVDGFDINKKTKENRSILNGAWSSYNIYEDKNIIGNVQVNRSYEGHYTDDDYAKVYAYIQEKDLQSNKIKEYEIPIESDIPYDINVDYNTVPLKYNNELYLTVLHNVEQGYNIKEKGENQIVGSKEIYINVYKIDLEKEISKLIKTKKIDAPNNKDNLIAYGNLAFSNNNKTYFMSEEYSYNEKNEYKSEFELIEYDVKSNEFNTIKTDIKSFEVGMQNNFYINDNKVTFVTAEEDSSKIDVYFTTIDLNTNKIIRSNEKYSLSLSDHTVSDQNLFEYYVNDFKIIDNKIYLTLRGWRYEDHYSRDHIREYVYVLDEKSKETLYTGKIKDKKGNFTDSSILKSEEL
ncbi:MAG: hypothetical protein ACRDD7_08965 [Peptostreptococcaceae bacterium]